MRRIISYPLVIAFFLFASSSFAQTSSLYSADTSLTKYFRKYILHTYLDNTHDSLLTSFKTRLAHVLNERNSFNYSFDSLSQYVEIATSANKKLRFYSWDLMMGGSHHFTSYITQFQSSLGKIVLQDSILYDIDIKQPNYESLFYEINEISIHNKIYYLVFGSGTHGEGMQHREIQLFKLENDKLISCPQYFPNKTTIILEYPRMDKINLSYDSKTQCISYNSINQSEDGRFYGRPGTKRTRLIFKNNSFVFEK